MFQKFYNWPYELVIYTPKFNHLFIARSYNDNKSDSWNDMYSSLPEAMVMLILRGGIIDFNRSCEQA